MTKASGIKKIENEIIDSVDERTNEEAYKSFSEIEEDIKLKSLRLDVGTREKFFNQYLRYRSILFYLLLILLIIESLAIFIIVILSSIRIYPCNSKLLNIDPGTLKILVGVTLAQICLMIIWIIRSVFPPDLVNIMGKTGKTE